MSPRSIRKTYARITDVKLSKKKSLGDQASSGKIDYHYLNYDNTFLFLQTVLNKNIQKTVCVPDIGEDWKKSLFRLHVKGSLNKVRPADSNETMSKFINEINKCLHKARFIPISLQIIVPNVGTHANMIIFDSKKKTIELFEPHGNRDELSSLEGISRGYYKVNRNIHRFFCIKFPDYEYISPETYLPPYGLQSKLDIYEGMCVTWCILYLHYRILNPNISRKEIVNYLNTKVTKNFLLRYTCFIEETIKNS